jgi:hypothetical protein
VVRKLEPTVSMADVLWARIRAPLPRRERAQVWGGVGERPWPLGVVYGGQGRAASWWECNLVHGSHVWDTCHPLRPFPEQVVGVSVAGVGDDLGRLRAKLDLGLITKFVVLMMLYNFD